jgi:hypothetical protein
MISKAKLTLIAAIAASTIALPAAALAQSAYTTGSAASRAAAGYSSPYGYGRPLRPARVSANSRFLRSSKDVEIPGILAGDRFLNRELHRRTPSCLATKGNLPY